MIEIRKPMASEISYLGELFFQDLMMQKEYLGALWSLEQLIESLQRYESRILFFKKRPCSLVIFSNIQTVGIEILLVQTQINEQRKGFSSHLIQELKSCLVQEEEIWLEVHEENKVALNFYNALGFKSTGKRKNYYQGEASALLMTYKSLDFNKVF